jgi:hypothetical protein
MPLGVDPVILGPDQRGVLGKFSWDSKADGYAGKEIHGAKVCPILCPPPFPTERYGVWTSRDKLSWAKHL